MSDNVEVGRDNAHLLIEQLDRTISIQASQIDGLEKQLADLGLKKAQQLQVILARVTERDALRKENAQKDEAIAKLELDLESSRSAEALTRICATALQTKRDALHARLDEAKELLRGFTGTLEQSVMCPMCSKRHCDSGCEVSRAKDWLAQQPTQEKA